MKEQFLQYLKDQKAKNELILAKNSISDEDKAIVTAAQENLATLLEQVEATPEEDQEIINELKNTVAALQESITAIKEKMNQQNKQDEEMKIDTENYLSTKNALHDFCSAIRNARNTEQFPAEWGKFLTANSVAFETGAETAYLPETVKSRIEDAWIKEFPWLSKLHKVNAKQYVIRWNKSNQDSETSRAKGHKKGEQKVEQEITFDAKTVIAKCIYKLQILDNETLWNDDSSLLDYVLDECLRQWHYEVAKSILVGDGRTSGTPDLRVLGLKSIARSVSDEFVSVSSRDTTTYPFLVDQLVKMRESVKVLDGTNDIMLFMTQSDINELRRVQASSTSSPVYIGIDQLAEMIGVKEIVECDYLGSDVEAIMFRPSKYVVIGENSPRMTQDEDVKMNQQIWRYENWIGGDVEGLSSAAVLNYAD